MLKFILIILFICTTTFAENIPHQSKEITEIYTRTDYVIYKDLKPRHQYKRFSDIFIFPDKFEGEAEFYDLKFFIDMDITINSYYDANCYRILYENRIQPSAYRTIIPEPTTLVTLLAGFCFLKIKQKKIKFTSF